VPEHFKQKQDVKAKEEEEEEKNFLHKQFWLEIQIID